MLSYDYTLAGFQKLSYEQKKAKVKEMLSILKEEGNVFDDLYKLINITDVSESLLSTIYEVIIKAMYSLKSQEMENAIEKLESMKEKIEEIKEKEEKEKSDADKILSKL